MKPSGDLPKKKTEKRRFWRWTAIFYGLMMSLYLYYMLANLSSAPKFIYTQF